MKHTAAADVSKRFYSEAELAVYLGVSPRSLQGWRLRGLGPPYRKLCGAVRYDIEAVTAYLANCPGGGGQ
jgi:hypothetical protein